MRSKAIPYDNPGLVMTTRLSGLRNARDLKASMLDLAVKAMESGFRQRLIVVSPRISAERIQAEWKSLTGLLRDDVASQVELELSAPDNEHTPSSATDRELTLPRSSTAFELLRLALDESLRGQPASTALAFESKLGLSEWPVRNALRSLSSAGLVKPVRRGVRVVEAPQYLSLSSLLLCGAAPGVLRLRSKVASGADWLEMARKALEASPAALWRVSAQHLPSAPPSFRLGGMPLMLVANVPAEMRSMPLSLLGSWANELEVEPRADASADVVVLVSYGPRLPGWAESTLYAGIADTCLSMVVGGLEGQIPAFLRLASTGQE